MQQRHTGVSTVSAIALRSYGSDADGVLMATTTDRLDTRLIRWIWISAATLGGSLLLVYLLAGRGFPALIVAVTFPAAALALQWVIRRRSRRRRSPVT